MRKFDYSFLKNNISAKTLNLISIIYDIKGKESVRLSLSPSLFTNLKKKAIRDSIKASNAIENIHTTEKRIDAIVSGDNNALTHSEKEIIGYRNVLNDIHTFHQAIKIDKVSILALHKQLLDVANAGNRGQFKKEPNIIAERKNGKMVSVFLPTPPNEVEEAVDAMKDAAEEVKETVDEAVEKE